MALPHTACYPPIAAPLKLLMMLPVSDVWCAEMDAAVLQVAGKMGATVQQFEEAPESHQEIRRSCKAVKLSYHDPTVIHQLNLQVAIAEERFDDACL